MNATKEMTFFYAGDIVRVKQDIPNSPKMVVKNIPKARRLEGDERQTMLLGVRCFWFAEGGIYQEQTFNTKDLEKC